MQNIKFQRDQFFALISNDLIVLISNLYAFWSHMASDEDCEEEKPIKTLFLAQGKCVCVCVSKGVSEEYMWLNEGCLLSGFELVWFRWFSASLFSCVFCLNMLW